MPATDVTARNTPKARAFWTPSPGQHKACGCRGGASLKEACPSGIRAFRPQAGRRGPPLNLPAVAPPVMEADFRRPRIEQVRADRALDQPPPRSSDPPWPPRTCIRTVRTWESILSVKSSAFSSRRLNEWSLRDFRGGSSNDPRRGHDNEIAGPAPKLWASRLARSFPCKRESIRPGYTGVLARTVETPRLTPEPEH